MTCRSFCLALGAAALALFMTMPSTRAQAPAKGKPAPESQTGLAVGTKAPAFTLNDQEGKPRSLESFLGKGKVALVFYRSADW